MTSQADITNMAVFCDFENVALGVADAKYAKFDIEKVLDRLLLKGSIVVKKAYCDWDRYKSWKGVMHEAAFELIEIPHVRMSGKNSADIRLVVDALDLCHTKPHVDTFVIISGDSDFSPLVSKLRENNKNVIGVGVKNSTSDLLIANCDEFIFYDDLVREKPARKHAAVEKASGRTAAKTPAAGDRKNSDDRVQEALDLILETMEALANERGEDGKIWGSMVKQALKRRKPGFNETYYGFRSFNDLLEEAEARNMLKLVPSESSGAYLVRMIDNDG
ncbi:MAG TPA: NYN domain-containing protein [Planctomycetota bacterium]|nr:NYN domain-containing protein [Planctomycetota bacterium]